MNNVRVRQSRGNPMGTPPAQWEYDPPNRQAAEREKRGLQAEIENIDWQLMRGDRYHPHPTEPDQRGEPFTKEEDKQWRVKALASRLDRCARLRRVNEYLDRLGPIVQHNYDMWDALCELEWSAIGDEVDPGLPVCPSCNALKDTQHQPDCKLGQALRRLPR